MHLPKCEHPVVIFSKKALTILEKSGVFYLTEDINYKNYHYEKGKQYISKEHLYTSNMFRYLMPIKETFSSNLSLLDNCYVVDALGQFLPLFIAVKCNKCSLCKEAKSFEWSTRCQLEAENYVRLPLMLTLTYNDNHLPNDGVRKQDVQKFLDRLRKQLERNGYDSKFRYVAVSEYGSKRHRAHYHLLLYGLDNKLSQYNMYSKRYDLTPAATILFQNSWSLFDRKTNVYDSFGFIYPKFCNNSNAGGYCVKYMRKGSNHPKGKNPCFFLTSRRNGCIGWLGFVYHKLNTYLHSCPTAPTFKYISRFDGKEKKIAIPSYFVKKVFPTFCDAIPCEVRRKLVNYDDTLYELRCRPLLKCLKDFRKQCGYSIQDSSFDLSYALKRRLGISNRTIDILHPRDYQDYSINLHRFDLWKRLSEAVPIIRSLNKVIWQTDKDTNLRNLYYTSRPQNDYNIALEVERTRIRTRNLFEAERDFQ